MTTDVARLARAMWAASEAHEDRDRCGWHPQLTEMRPYGIGERWQGDEWPGGDPTVLLGDWLVAPDTTCLLLVSVGTAHTSAGEAPVRVVVGVGADGDAAMFVGDRLSGPVPLELAGYGGEIVAAMRACFDRSDITTDITRGGEQ